MLESQEHLFSLPADLHYLNCAYMSPLPKPVMEAGIAGLRRKCDPSTIAQEDFFLDCYEIRRRFARLVNIPDPRTVAIIPSASYGLAIVARNSPVRGDQNIVTAADQFPSNVYAWRRIAEDTGAELRVVSPPESDDRSAAWSDSLLEAIDRSTAIVALGHIHWTDGTLIDLERIGAHAREVGAAFIVDGTQSVGALPFDVQELKPDALVCPAYKWLLGPYGIGVAYYGARYADGVPLEETWIGRTGSEDFRRLVDYQDTYRPGAIRYDAGESSNFAHAPMLKTALGMILEWGVEEIQRYCGSLVAPLAHAVRGRGWTIDEEANRAGHVLGIRMPPTFNTSRLKEALDEHNVSVSLRGDSIRISPHVYNDAEDIDALIAALDSAL